MGGVNGLSCMPGGVGGGGGGVTGIMNGGGGGGISSVVGMSPSYGMSSMGSVGGGGGMSGMNGMSPLSMSNVMLSQNYGMQHPTHAGPSSRSWWYGSQSRSDQM